MIALFFFPCLCAIANESCTDGSVSTSRACRSIANCRQSGLVKFIDCHPLFSLKHSTHHHHYLQEAVGSLCPTFSTQTLFLTSHDSITDKISAQHWGLSMIDLSISPSLPPFLVTYYYQRHSSPVFFFSSSSSGETEREIIIIAHMLLYNTERPAGGGGGGCDTQA